MATYLVPSFAIDYTATSGSANATGAADYVPSSPSPKVARHITAGPQLKGNENFGAVSSSVTTTTVTESLTIKYFQRVYDAGTAGWCYYEKTSIDATPSAGETTPNYEGEISNHSIVKILEIY
jgi:hypothetical protein